MTARAPAIFESLVRAVMTPFLLVLSTVCGGDRRGQLDAGQRPGPGADKGEGAAGRRRENTFIGTARASPIWSAHFMSRVSSSPVVAELLRVTVICHLCECAQPHVG